MIAAAGSQAKLDAVKKYTGADHLIDYTKPGWQKEVLKVTSGHGVDVVYDPVGLIQGISIAYFPDGGGSLYMPHGQTHSNALLGRGGQLLWVSPVDKSSRSSLLQSSKTLFSTSDSCR